MLSDASEESRYKYWFDGAVQYLWSKCSYVDVLLMRIILLFCTTQYFITRVLKMFLFIIMLLKPFVVGNCSAKGLFPIFLQSVYKATLIVWKKKNNFILQDYCLQKHWWTFWSSYNRKNKEKNTPMQLHNVRMIVLNISEEIRWNRKN